MRNLYEVLKERGFVEQCTDEGGVVKWFDTPGNAVYVGFDPTADSLHLGSLIPLIGLMHVQRAGHKAVALVGGATGMVGDPSGKSAERSFLDDDDLAYNLDGMRSQMESFFDFEGDSDHPAAMVLNNADWIADVSLIDWLRGIGKMVSVNTMMSKESVRRRLEDRDQGISYTEFSYMLLQAWDFVYLNETHGCRVQMGGSDQWGNITAGIDLIRRRSGEQAYGITFPLLETASGEKFGKSEGNAIWLDPKRTSIWDFYQYLIRTDDRDVIKHLKLFTFLPLEEIEKLAKDHEENPGSRIAHKRLALEVTALVHGMLQAERMVAGAEALYSGRLEDLDSDLINQVFSEGPSCRLSSQRLELGVDLVDLVAECALVKSKSEARRMLKQGALYVNDQRAEEGKMVDHEDILPSGVVVLRKGKRDYLLLQFD
ncbi:tyrosine--tRNA ligase 1 [bacterium BMS3Bbin04]|nr:tyrosine--tRNA ligase 1 [bacterium BMS3Bbin04]